LTEISLRFFGSDCVKPKQGFDPPFSAQSQPKTNELPGPMATAKKPIKSLIRGRGPVKRESRLDF
jgi:hypothetical protein